MRIKTRDIIPAGTNVILTSGAYEDYRIIGLFRAATNVVVPTDTRALADLLEALPYRDIWTKK